MLTIISTVVWDQTLIFEELYVPCNLDSRNAVILPLLNSTLQRLVADSCVAVSKLSRDHGDSNGCRW